MSIYFQLDAAIRILKDALSHLKVGVGFFKMPIMEFLELNSFADPQRFLRKSTSMTLAMHTPSGDRNGNQCLGAPVRIHRLHKFNQTLMNKK
jgi:hypothetical protein